ncbi:MAG: hypothetical protein IPM27_12235 [Nitrosomonadales bacterium]|nr:hypothetical protein [Nitrosomonadales bacterium]
MQTMLALLEEGYSADALRLYFGWLHRVKAQYGIKPGRSSLSWSPVCNWNGRRMKMVNVAPSRCGCGADG